MIYAENNIIFVGYMPPSLLFAPLVVRTKRKSPFRFVSCAPRLKPLGPSAQEFQPIARPPVWLDSLSVKPIILFRWALIGGLLLIKFKWLIFLCLFLADLSGKALAADKIVLNTGIRDPFTTMAEDGFVDQIVKEAFRRAGLEVTIIVYQNSAKSLENANRGIDDGAALRIMGLEKKFPNLIRVPEKMMDNDFLAYSLREQEGLADWASLKQKRIAYIGGWQIFQNNLQDHPATVKTKNAQQMFDLLSAGEVDLILYERWQGLWRAKQLGLRPISAEPPLAKREMFMYLNEKHRPLVTKVSNALASMKKDGTYARIFNDTLGKLRN